MHRHRYGAGGENYKLLLVWYGLGTMMPNGGEVGFDDDDDDDDHEPGFGAEVEDEDDESEP